MAFIAFFDLLGTRGFCDNSDIYYDNILRFNKAVIQTSALLLDYGKVGVFSDSAYAGSNSLKHMLDFLVSLRRRLMAEGLFFNAVVKRGELDFEEIKPKTNNVFGVAFKNSEIADLYITQANFKGVGIFVDSSIRDEEIAEEGYSVNYCVYAGRSGQEGIGEWHPVKYRDISLQTSFPEKRQQNMALEIFLRVFYASYMKAPKYGAYYISLLSNFIRSFGTNLKWDLTERAFIKPPLIFDVLYKMITTEYKMLSCLPGLEYLVFVMLDMVYSSENLSEQDKISITKKYVDIECIHEKYLHNLNCVPENIFSVGQGVNHRAQFIRYCQEDFASEFIENVMANS